MRRKLFDTYSRTRACARDWKGVLVISGQQLLLDKGMLLPHLEYASLPYVERARIFWMCDRRDCFPLANGIIASFCLSYTSNLNAQNMTIFIFQPQPHAFWLHAVRHAEWRCTEVLLAGVLPFIVMHVCQLFYVMTGLVFRIVVMAWSITARGMIFSFTMRDLAGISVV